MSVDSSAAIVTATADLLAREPIAWALARLHSSAHSNPVVASGRTRIEVALQTGSLGPESFALAVDATPQDGLRVTVSSADDRGFVYALNEIAERLESPDLAELVPGERLEESPAVPLRGIHRNFSSVHEDSPWFHDQTFWTGYLDHLAAQRFNRFQLGFGMQYNYGTGWESRTATDNYLCFAYPFLLDVPGYRVRAQGVDADERDKNFAALAFIARETKRRGMSFQLGLWNHAYDFAFDSPQWYPILGVSEENHAQYSADAVRLLLERIPEIDGVTFRVHHEGGVHEEGHEAFWGTVFSAMAEVGRPLVVDMHAKGVDQALIDAVQKPNLTPLISGKYWAEHMGLPYHQATIRDREKKPLRRAGMDASVTGVTDGARRFTRYGYGDFLSEDRDVDFMFRMWPGTQKLLLWGDPAMASGFGRYATIGGSRGLEYCEPLFFKGRRGTGIPGGREVYERGDLTLGTDDWRKFSYTYLLWGRLLYNPDTTAQTWRRLLRTQYGPAAADVEVALSSLSRILPLITVVHGASAANNFYWPEMYLDLPISHWKPSMHYAFDIPDPRTFEAASPFDPTMFYAVGEYADDALAGRLSAKHTPLEVAGWVEALTNEGDAALQEAERSARDDPQTLRTLVDLRVLVCLGRFFSGKFRAGVTYALFRRSGDRSLLETAIAQLREAHQSYARVAEIVQGVYRDDLAFGVGASERGTWRDRVTTMREDLFLLERELATLAGASGMSATYAERADRGRTDMSLSTPERFTRGEDVRVCLLGDDPRVTGAVLRYRHLNHAEEFESVEMVPSAEGFEAVIPARYTATAFPLVVLAEVAIEGDFPIFVPPFDADLSNQPYVVIHSDVWRGQAEASGRGTAS